MSIRIITDSASDINQNEFENVMVIPMTVAFDGKEYLDGVDISKDDFYNLLLASEEMPASSLVSPFQFKEAFEKITADGDEAIVIPISAGLSGTYQSALIAADDFDNVSVIDSGLVAAAERLLIIHCQNLIDKGLSRAEIVEQLEKDKERIIIYAAVDTLKYLQKGGRISKGAAIVGTLINIKPIVALEDGKLIAIGKVRGSKQSNKFLNEKINEHGGIDYSMPYSVGYAGVDRTNLEQYIESNKDLIPPSDKPLDVVQIGSAVGTHCGPGAVLVTFFAKA